MFGGTSNPQATTFLISRQRLNNQNTNALIQAAKAHNVKNVWLDIEVPAGPSLDDYTYNWYQKVCVSSGLTCGVYSNFWGMGPTRANFPKKSARTPLSKMYLWFAEHNSKRSPTKTLSWYGWKKSDGRQYGQTTACSSGKTDLNSFSPYVFSGAPPSSTETSDAVVVSCTSGRVIVGNLSDDNTVNLRSGPGTSTSILTKIPDSAQLNVISRDSGEYYFDKDLDEGSATWIKVSYNGKTGYINALYGVCS